jgi:ketosteroid isomerase-like protein
LRVAVLRLPTSSRLRREIVARSIRDNADAYARRDYDAFMVGFDPEIVIDTGDAFPESNVYHGLEGMRRFLAMFEEVWQDYVIEPEEVVDFGDRYVLVAAVSRTASARTVRCIDAASQVSIKASRTSQRWRFFLGGQRSGLWIARAPTRSGLSWCISVCISPPECV